jgi:hypothetical protein
MAKVTSRTGLAEHAMRALGAPVIEINVDEDQVEDRIDDALQYYQEYHADAVVRTYLKHELTAEDVTNSYISIPDNITSVVRLLDMGGGSVESLFNVNYHMRLSDMMSMNTGSLDFQMYEQRMQHLALLDQRLNSTELLRFNRHMNRLYTDEGFSSLKGSVCSNTSYTTESTCIAAGETWTAGGYIIVEAYTIVDPTTYSDVYNDMFLKRYVTSLIKRQWGQNMLKFDGFQLPGGITMNGRQIYDDAVEEINKLEEEMQLAWMLPDEFFMG